MEVGKQEDQMTAQPYARQRTLWQRAGVRVRRALYDDSDLLLDSNSV
jgi:hypothetical protein